MKTKRIILVFALMVFTSEIHVLLGQEAGGEYSKIIFSEHEMAGYTLRYQNRIPMIIAPDKFKDIIYQRWHKDGEDSDTYIYYSVFNNSEEAISGWTYQKSSVSGIFNWGIFDGTILGDKSWSIDALGSSIIFIRGNIGIQISQTGSKVDLQIMERIARTILSKIESLLNPEIRAAEETAKEKQISSEHYRIIINKALQSDAMSGFSVYSSWDSKWPIDENHYIAGRCMEWKNKRGAIIGIDIAEFESEDSTEKAKGIRLIEQMTRPVYPSMFDMDVFASIDSLVEKRITTDLNLNPREISGISSKGRIALHIYHYDPNQNDNALFSSITKLVASQVFF